MYDFIKWEPSTILEGAIEEFEKETGESLYAGDERRIMINTFMYVATIIANKANYLANQQLVETMDEEHLIKYGESIGVIRKVAAKASTIVTFNLACINKNEVFIPMGTRVTPNGLIFFKTVVDAVIRSGELSCQVECIAADSGSGYNDFRVGDICTLTDSIPYISSVSNTTITSGGTDEEDLETYRNRVMLKPWNYSTGGTQKSYRYVVLDSSSEVKDCTVLSHEDDLTIEDSTILITCVGEGGEILSESTIEQVHNYVNQNDIRVQNDKIIVQSPNIVSYDIELEYHIDESDLANENEIKSEVESAVAAFVKNQDSEIGRVINPNILRRDIIKAGAFDVNIIKPAITSIDKKSISKCNTIDINYKGIYEI